MRKALLYSLSLLLVLPLFYLFVQSISAEWNFPAIFPERISFKKWNLNEDLWHSLGISLILSFSIALAATIFGLIISRYLHNSSFVNIAYFPYLVAPVIFGSMLHFYFIKLGLRGTFGGVWLAQALFIFPYSVLLLSAFWSQKVKQSIEQALVLGANRKQLWFKAIVPLSKPWLFLAWAQCFIISWFEYGITDLIGLGKIPTLTVRSMHYLQEANVQQAAVSSMLMIIPLAIMLLINRQLIFKRNPL